MRSLVSDKPNHSPGSWFVTSSKLFGTEWASMDRQLPNYGSWLHHEKGGLSRTKILADCNLDLERAIN